jgi:hypothetical protein
MKRKANNRVKLVIFILGTAAIVNLLVFGGRVENEPKALPRADAPRKLRTGGDNTTIIITSSLIPSHPSLELIDQTIESLRFIEGISKDTPLIITVDGAYKKERGPDAAKTKILQEYTDALRHKYSNLGHVTILSDENNIKLVGNVRKAMKLVKTEFVYLVQHDMPFVASINHTGLVKTFRSHEKSVRLVRFSPRKTLVRSRDRIPGVCKDEEIEVHANGIHLSKTHTWSDK